MPTQAYAKAIASTETARLAEWPMTKPKHKRDNPAQSRMFIKTAREIEADEDRSIADDLLKQLAKRPPDPRDNKARKKPKK